MTNCGHVICFAGVWILYSVFIQSYDTDISSFVPAFAYSLEKEKKKKRKKGEMGRSEGKCDGTISWKYYLLVVRNNTTAGGGRLISAVELSNFSAEILFSPEVFDACEAAADVVTGYRDEAGLKRLLDREGGSEIDEPFAKKRRQIVTAPKFEDRREKDRTKKNRKVEERWKTHGHLPRQSVIENYIGNCNGWKSSYKIDKMPSKAGGYAAKSIKFEFENVKDILTVEEGKMLGFKVVGCSGL
jgi:hypothetical protein